MKSKIKTHKGAKKRVQITPTGKVVRQKRRNRNQRFARGTNSKDGNNDKKFLQIDKSESKRIKRLLAI